MRLLSFIICLVEKASDSVTARGSPSGTATTMEVVSETGQFIGGVIAPGLGLSAQALRDHTELLPLVECRNAPVAERVIGRNTEAAIHSGVWWGQVGAIREWISRTQLELQATADVFVTGGASSALAPYLGNQVRHVPELCLQGIAIWGSCSREINGVIE